MVATRRRQYPSVSWYSLPTELRLLILGHLVVEESRPYQSPESRQRERKSTTAPQGTYMEYAVVSQEWQFYFEPQVFKRLIIDHTDIEELGRLISQSNKGHMLRWIWLRIQLPKYGCSKCRKKETEKEKETNERIFTVAIERLLGFLAKLGSQHPGIALKLSVHSPSDSEHYCKELGNTMNDTVWHHSKTHAPIRKPNDRFHGWRGGRRLDIPVGAHERIFGDAKGFRMNLENWGKVPKAAAVKELVIRFQFSRHLSVRQGILPILKNLPRLHTIRYECKKAATVAGQRLRKTEQQLLVANLLVHCKMLRTLSMYEGGVTSYYPARELSRYREEIREYYPAPQHPPGYYRNHRAGISLSNQSCLLRELYVGYMVDAADFFFYHPRYQQIPPLRKPHYPQLEYLSLTTCFFPRPKMHNLLQAAAWAAEDMPRLKTMHISGWHKHEVFFYYLEHTGQHTIIVPKVWTSPFGAATIQAWQRFADLRGSLHPLRVSEPSEARHSPRLSRRALTMTSVRQLRDWRDWGRPNLLR